MKKIKVLALVLVFAFAAMGGAYAVWTDNVTATDILNTGTVDIAWVDNTSSSDPQEGEGTTGNPTRGNWHYVGHTYLGFQLPADTETRDYEYCYNGYGYGYYDLIPGQYTPGEGITDAQGGSFGDNDQDFVNQDDKDVAYKTVELLEDGVLEMTIENGYPGYNAYVIAELKNIGTIPVTINDVKTTGASKVEILVSKVDNLAGDNDTDLIGTVIDPYASIFVKFDETVLDMNNGAQNDTFTSSIKINAIQWNAYDYGTD